MVVVVAVARVVQVVAVEALRCTCTVRATFVVPVDTVTGTLNVYPTAADALVVDQPDTVVAVRGVVDAEEDRVRIRAQDVVAPQMTAEGASPPVLLTLASVRCTPGVVARLKQVLAEYPGPTDVHLQLRSDAKVTTFRLGDGYKVSPSSPLFADLKAILGPGAVAVSKAGLHE